MDDILCILVIFYVKLKLKLDFWKRFKRTNLDELLLFFLNKIIIKKAILKTCRLYSLKIVIETEIRLGKVITLTNVELTRTSYKEALNNYF